VAAKLRHAGLKRVARARRFLEEEHVERLGAQDVVMQFAHRKAPLEVIGHIQRRLQLRARPILGGDKVLAKQLRIHVPHSKFVKTIVSRKASRDRPRI
jgi:hypothetical protein